RSIFIHKDPQKLTKKYAGKGIRDSNISPGKPGYKEIVNFKEYIGYDVNRITGEKWKTSAKAFVELSHKKLMENSEMLMLLTERGLSLDTICKFSLGWNPMDLFEKR
ncbi:MAG: polymorphic toxin type 50 domain-containing protein, partial [Candidatus Thorarchaeota archaeon]